MKGRCESVLLTNYSPVLFTCISQSYERINDEDDDDDDDDDDESALQKLQLPANKVRILCASYHTCFCRIGSRAGSSSSPTFSSRHGLPKRTAFSILRRKSLSDIFITSIALSFSCISSISYNIGLSQRSAYDTFASHVV